VLDTVSVGFRAALPVVVICIRNNSLVVFIFHIDAPEITERLGIDGSLGDQTIRSWQTQDTGNEGRDAEKD
jgi:hypothetical protein